MFVSDLPQLGLPPANPDADPLVDAMLSAPIPPRGDRAHDDRPRPVPQTAFDRDPHLAAGLNVRDGRIMHSAVATSLGFDGGSLGNALPVAAE